MKLFENRLPPPVLMLLVAVLMWTAARFLNSADSASRLSETGGAILACLGLGVGASGFFEFRRMGTTIDPVNIDRAEKLVTSGVFRWSRNPMYLGFVLMLLGWSAYLGWSWTLAGPALFALFIQRFQIVPEERIMAAKFGDSFENYRQRVRPWF